jgi:succinate dehydrogenase / fumarate reductase flavoprotein subunit
VRVVGAGTGMNRELERAGRVADFLELAELIARDALHRDESCGGHFRVEHQTPEGEAARDDGRFCHVAAWEWRGEGAEPVRHVEPLAFENVPLAVRSYK